MRRCIVLLEDRCVLSNAADHWQQFLHQQCFSLILLDGFSPRFNKDEVGMTEFHCHDRFAESGMRVQKIAGTDVVLFACHCRIYQIIF